MFNIKNPFKKLGPGIITGASDDDPSGIAVYSQTGARFGYSLLWMAPLTIPLMFAVQEMSARLGMVTGRGLAGIIRRYVSRRTVVVLSLMLFVANVVNIGANISAMAAASKLILPGPTALYLIFFAVLIAGLEMFTSYRQYVRVLRWLIISLFAYVITAFLTKQDWGAILQHSIIPSLPSGPGAAMMIVAILGTTIAPYLFFWQASEEVEEEIDSGRKNIRTRRGATAAELKDMRLDVLSGMALSNVIMFFIIITTAGTLHVAGLTDIQTSEQAAAALRPLGGELAFVLFALGIIGTGMIGIPVLAASASFAFAEAFGWREGLEKTFKQARPFHLVILLAIGLGVLTNALGVSAIEFLIGAAVINGLLAPVLLWYITRLADRPDVVGEHVSPPWIRFLGRLTLGVMALAGAVFLWQLIF